MTLEDWNNWVYEQALASQRTAYFDVLSKRAIAKLRRRGLLL